MKVARLCPHCKQQTSVVKDGTYRCELDKGGCGGTFTIGDEPYVPRPRAPGLRQMRPEYRFIGGRIGNLSSQSSRGKESFRVKGTSPNVEAQKTRKMWSGALGVLADQLQGLMDSAEMPEEAAYWLGHLERLKGGRGE